MGVDRFKNLHSNGPLPGGERGRFERNLKRTYGIDPVVSGRETRREQRQRRRGRKPDKKGHLVPVGTHGTMRWVPN